MANKMNSTKVVTGVVRLSYANVWEPASINGSNPKYSVSLIIPKSDKQTLDAINAAVDAAIKEGVAKFGGKIPNKAALKLPLRDGDIVETTNHCIRPATIVDWDLGNISYPFGNLWCENIQIRSGSNTVARFGFNGGTFECLFSGAAVNRLGSSVYYWDTGYIEKLYLSSNCYLTASAGKLCVNGTAIGGSSDITTSFAGKELKMGGSTSYYIIASTARELKPSASGTTYPFYLGTSSLYWHYAYLGSNTAKIGSSASSKIGFFAGSPIARQTLSPYSQNMGYSTATASNYLKILNNLVGILSKYGLIGT